ncbi:unnamed protein product [Rhodiola kirilowii]
MAQELVGHELALRKGSQNIATIYKSLNRIGGLATSIHEKEYNSRGNDKKVIHESKEMLSSRDEEQEREAPSDLFTREIFGVGNPQ